MFRCLKVAQSNWSSRDGIVAESAWRFVYFEWLVMHIGAVHMPVLMIFIMARMDRPDEMGLSPSSIPQIWRQPTVMRNGKVSYFHALFSECLFLFPSADVDECQVHNGGCQHRCVNTLGSYYCECKPGFRLHTDGRTCIGKLSLKFFW